MNSRKLYYTKTSCGAASFVTAKLGGVDLDAEIVDLQTHLTASGRDFYEINVKGNVPAIVFANGSVLNENVATLAYLADQGDAGLAPQSGTLEWYHFLADLAFVASELHPAFGAFLNPDLSTDARAAAMENVKVRMEKLATRVGGRSFLNGTSLSAADIYAYIVLTWGGFLNVGLSAPIQAYFDGLARHDVMKKGLATLR